MRSFLVLLACSLSASFACAQPARAQMPSTGRVTLALTMRLHDTARLDALIRGQSDPSSPLYAHFLSPAQFEAAFAPTAAEYASTVARLRQDGIRVERTYRSRIAIVGSAPAATAHRVFAAAAHANRSYDVPRELAATVEAVTGADASDSATTTAANGVRHTRVASLAASTTSSLYGPDDGFGPTGVTVANDFPVLHGYPGTGVKVADIVDSAASDTIIATFLGQFGITRTGPPTTNVGLVGGGYTDLYQSNFDAEWTIGTAPGVSYYTYQFSNFNPSILATFAQVVDDNIADVVNYSFVACETDDSLAFALAPIFKRAVAQGMTFEAVTFGTFGEPNVCSTQVAEGEVPSSDENVLAVSGSSAIENADGSLVAQSAFPQSGGGVSLLFPVKAWQRSIPGVNLAGRNTPDIVLTTEVNGAGPSAYTAMIVQDYYYPPAWDGGQDVVDNASAAGLLAGIQEMVGHRLGAFNQTLYELFAKTGYGTAFKDITVGCNGFLNGKAFCAKAGYDLTSGVGTIDAYQVGKLLH